MRGNSAGRRHFGLLEQLSAHGQMVKPLTKVKIQPGSTVPCEQREYIERFHVKRSVRSNFSTGRKSTGTVWTKPKAWRKRTQHWWPTTPNNVGSCYVRLHVAKSLTGFKLCATTHNNAQQHEQGVQTDATCNIKQCWELLANNVASVCIRLKRDITRDDSQRRFLAQHRVPMLVQCCSHSKQCCTQCCNAVLR